MTTNSYQKYMESKVMETAVKEGMVTIGYMCEKCWNVYETEKSCLRHEKRCKK